MRSPPRHTWPAKTIFGIRYKPCGAAAFRADAGKVVYFTSLTYHGEGRAADGWGETYFRDPDYSQDLEGARAFLSAHYPGLAASLEQENA